MFEGQMKKLILESVCQEKHCKLSVHKSSDSRTISDGQKTFPSFLISSIGCQLLFFGTRKKDLRKVETVPSESFKYVGRICILRSKVSNNA